MRKFGRILDEIVQKAQSYGLELHEMKNCKGRAQLLMYIRKDFFFLYERIVTLELLREMYSEEALNKQGIYTIGTLNVDKPKEPVMACGNVGIIAKNATIYAYDKAVIQCSGTCDCIVRGDVKIIAHDDTKVIAMDRCQVKAVGYNHIHAIGMCRIIATAFARVTAKDNCIVTASGYTVVHSKGNSHVKITDNAVCYTECTGNVEVEDLSQAVVVGVEENAIRYGKKIKQKSSVDFPEEKITDLDTQGFVEAPADFYFKPQNAQDINAHFLRLHFHQ